MKKLWGCIKKIFRRIRDFVNNPGKNLAEFIFSAYGRDRDKLPFVLFKFVYKYFGGWPGASIYWEVRKHKQKIKKNKLKNIIVFVVVPILIITGIVLIALQRNENFLFGFAQNLASDIVLLLLTIYFLPKVLRPPKKYHVSLRHRNLGLDGASIAEEKQEIIISIINTGDEIYKPLEISWELFFPDRVIEQDDFEVLIGELDKNEGGLFLEEWRAHGINSQPIFLDDRLDILKVQIHKELLYGVLNEPFYIYYRLKTINGNIPTMENATIEFINTGYSCDKSPVVGRYVFDDWYDPDYLKRKNEIEKEDSTQ